MAATVAVGVPAGTGSTGSSPPARASPAAPANPSAATARRRVGPPDTSRSQASVLPTSASRKLSRGAPPMAAHGAVGAPAWLMASLPHGNAYGHRARSASAATHQPATASGQARSRNSICWPMVSSAKITASAAASAAQAYQATLISQDSRGTNRASPNTSPITKLARRLRRQSATTSSAGPSGASGHRPTGGKAAVSSSPPARAMSSAHGSARRGPVLLDTGAAAGSRVAPASPAAVGSAEAAGDGSAAPGDGAAVAGGSAGAAGGGAGESGLVTAAAAGAPPGSPSLPVSATTPSHTCMSAYAAPPSVAGA